MTCMNMALVDATTLICPGPGLNDTRKTCNPNEELYCASKDGDLPKLCKFLKEGTNPNPTNLWKCPLHSAKTVSVARELVNHGADLEQQDGSGLTPLHTAAWDGKSNVAKFLMERGANIHAVDRNYGWTPLHYASHYGRFEVAELLLSSKGGGANLVECRNACGNTALHCAAMGGQTEMIGLLCKKFGADLEAKNKDHKTPLHEAARYGKTQAVQLLLNEGADANALGHHAKRPLHEAIGSWYGNAHVVQALLHAGANVEARDKDGRTALHLAANGGTTHLMQLLLEHNDTAVVGAKDKNNRTPLYYAALSGQPEAVWFLLEWDAIGALGC